MSCPPGPGPDVPEDAESPAESESDATESANPEEKGNITPGHTPTNKYLGIITFTNILFWCQYL